jgi:hypothetical protein
MSRNVEAQRVGGFVGEPIPSRTDQVSLMACDLCPCADDDRHRDQTASWQDGRRLETHSTNAEPALPSGRFALRVLPMCFPTDIVGKQPTSKNAKNP